MDKVLKPCPFCGGAAHVGEDMRFSMKSHDFPKWYIFCYGCGVRTPIADMANVVKIWNRRDGVDNGFEICN